MECPTCGQETLDPEQPHLFGCPYYGRATGKTTRLIEEAIDLIAEGYDVIIVGPHPNWVRDLRGRFKVAGLVGLRLFTVDEIKYGKHRGLKAKMLFDDFEDMRPTDMQMLLMERKVMEAYFR